MLNEVYGMGLTLNIDRVIYELSKRRPIFHSETDFQFSLAWIIKEQYPNCDIRLEFVQNLILIYILILLL